MLLLALLAQAAVELRPTFQKFDRLTSSCTIRTEIKSSNGRDSAYVLSIEFTAEVEKSEGGAAVFDCGVSRLRIEGTLDGRKVDAEWAKSGGWKGDGKLAGIDRALEKGWKMTLEAGKGTSIGDGFLELGDLLPLFNPGVLLGFPVPPPAAPVAVEKGWPTPGQTYAHAGGFGIKATGFFDFFDGSAAKLSAPLILGKAGTEAPIEGEMNVKGKGFASMTYDVKKGRPLKGATSVQVVIGQGGLKKEISQVVEFEMR